MLYENTKKLVVECFTVSEKRPKEVLIESSSSVHRVMFSGRLEGVSFQHIRQNVFLWHFLYLTSSNMLHEVLRS